MPKLSIQSIVIIIISVIILALGLVLLAKLNVFTDLIIPNSYGSIKAIVTPTTSQIGTVFLLKATSIKTEQQELKLYIKGKDHLEKISLYDDGFHQDDEPKDKTFATNFDSTNLTLGQYYLITYNENNKEEILATFSVSQDQCIPIIGNGEIKVVIIPQGYTNLEEVKKDTINLISKKDSLLEVEPFKSNKDSFSFLTVNNSADLECDLECKGVSTLVCCNNKKVFEEASKCSYDNILVLINNKKACGSASSYAKICAKNSDAPLIFMHEFGHSFADLADEYVYANYFGNYSIGEVDEVNCANEGCSKWGGGVDSCFQGCTYDSLYRSVKKNTIMLDLYPQFNTVSINHIKNIITNYQQTTKINENPSLEKSYTINLNYNNEKITINNIYLNPIKSNPDFKKSKYSALIKDQNNNKLFSTSITLPTTIRSLPGKNETIFKENQFEFTINLPYQPKASDLFFYKEDKLLVSTNINVFNDNCGNNFCDISENHASCPNDCTIDDNFCEAGLCDPDCSNYNECKKNNNMKNGVPIFLISFALILLIISFLRIKRK